MKMTNTLNMFTYLKIIKYLFTNLKLFFEFVVSIVFQKKKKNNPNKK